MNAGARAGSACGSRRRLVLAFIYVPLALVVIYAFNASGTSAWPPSGFTLTWFGEALENTGLREAFLTSIACALGRHARRARPRHLASFAVARYSFFGRESDLVRRPAADRAARHRHRHGAVDDVRVARHAARDPDRSIIGHATFCVVLVYNNAIARLRRTVALARGGVGRPRRRHLPDLPLRDVPGAAHRRCSRAALLAFALSFDEVIVTIFTAGGVKTLPIWIFQSFRLANQVPLVNVAGVVAILLSVIPVYLATRISSEAVAGAHDARSTPPAGDLRDERECSRDG